MKTISRRKMLADTLTNVGTLAAIASLSSCAAIQTNSAHPQVNDLEYLASVTFDLFPYADLPAELYVKVAANLLAGNNPLVHSGLKQLKQLTNERAWSELNENTRVQTLSSVQSTPFFSLLRTATIETIYREPELFTLLGYGGSSIEYGGYINRGFDDIDWLENTDQLKRNN